MIQLAHVLLPAGLLWTDEFGWQPVAQAVDRALDGSRLSFSSALTGGRPITLESGSWLKYSDVQALQELASQPGATYALELRGVTYQVEFRHAEPPAFAAAPLFPLAFPAPDDRYTATLKLSTV